MDHPPERRTVNLAFETLFERILFGSRWLLAPLYAGLVIVLLLILASFCKQLVHQARHLAALEESDVVVTALSLVDLVLLGNLVLMVMLTGYENVVSRLNIGSGDRPSWLRKLDATGLKLRLFGSIAAISGIQVLRAFMDLSDSAAKVLSEQEHATRQWSLQWMLITHGVFVLSGLAIAFTERLAHGAPTGGSTESVHEAAPRG